MAGAAGVGDRLQPALRPARAQVRATANYLLTTYPLPTHYLLTTLPTHYLLTTYSLPRYALRAARENGQQGADDETKVASL